MRTREIERVFRNMLATVNKMELNAASVKEDLGEECLLIQTVQWERATEAFWDMAKKLIKRLRKDDQNQK